MIVWIGTMIVGLPVVYLLSTWQVRRAYRRMLACTNPLHRAEASRRAAVKQVVAVGTTVWGAVVLTVNAALPEMTIPGTLVAMFLSFAVMLAGVMVLELWAMRRCRALGLSESVCA